MISRGVAAKITVYLLSERETAAKRFGLQPAVTAPVVAETAVATGASVAPAASQVSLEANTAAQAPAAAIVAMLPQAALVASPVTPRATLGAEPVAAPEAK